MGGWYSEEDNKWTTPIKGLCCFSLMVTLIGLVIFCVMFNPGASIPTSTMLKAESPHIVFIMADDLGWGNVGFHNKHNYQINTPNLDDLASTGLQLNRMYVYRGCAPSRSSFQSGRLPVHVTMDNGDGITTPNHGIPAEMTGIASKLKEAHYSTHLVGKWDAGFASFAQIPINKGYDSFYGYLGKVISYFDKTSINDCPNMGDVDLWEDDHPAIDPVDDDEYVEFAFKQKALDIIDDYNTKSSEGPLFLLYSSHLPHYPSMVPKDHLERDKYRDDTSSCSASTDYIYPGNDDGDSFQCRTVLQSQVNLLDEIIGDIVDKLKSKGLWKNTLFIVQSDNGGSIQINYGAGNNYPLRGGKSTDFEGGIRAVTVVNGGYLPDARRGQTEQGMMHIADWYATFCALNGIDHLDATAVSAGLPDVDSINMWPLLSGEVTESPRHEIIVSDHTLIVDNWKLFVGHHKYAVWQSAIWPDSKTPSQDELRDEEMNCFSADNLNENAATGCLFDVVKDEAEKHDVAFLYRDIVEEMMAKLEEYNTGFYENDRVGEDSCPEGYDLTVTVGTGKASTQHLECGCWMAMYNYGAFDGPYQDVDDQYIRYNEGEGIKEVQKLAVVDEEEMVDITWDDQDTAMTSPRIDLKHRYLKVIFSLCGLIGLLLVCMAIKYLVKKREKRMPLLSEYDSEFYGINRT